MEILQLENDVYTPICSQCQENCSIQINKKDLLLNTICRNGHSTNLKPCQIKCTKSISLTYNYCSCCFSILNEKFNNYICLNCNKLICSECINKHKFKGHSDFKLYYNQYLSCPLHNLKSIFFCLKCKNNFCKDCAHLHKEHLVKCLIDMIPNNKEKEFNKDKIKENTEKIKANIQLLRNLKEKIDRRINKLVEYFLFLSEINKNFLENFNYSYYNYYNYENYNYLYNYINKEINIENSKLNNYILNGDNLYPEEKDIIIKPIPILKTEEIDLKDEVINFPSINNLNKLEYFKDNIFFIFLEDNFRKKKTIILYEYRDFSFKELCTYSFESSYKIGKIKVSHYNNYIFLICLLFKKIKILEYNPIERKISYIKKEIREKKQYGQFFSNAIDIKNGNIVTVDSQNLTIWKKNNNNIRYNKIKAYSCKYKDLFNLNDSFFVCEDYNKKIHFYHTANYALVKTLTFLDEFKFLGTIQDRIFALITLNNKFIFLIDLKYLDISQIINVNDINVEKLLLLNDSLLNIEYIGNKIVIEKKLFDFKNGSFQDAISFKKEFKNFSISKILKTENNSIIFVSKEQITLIKI